MNTEFNSNLILSVEQLGSTPDLEPAFENLFRNVGVHEAIITALLWVSVFTDGFKSTWHSAFYLKFGAHSLEEKLSAQTFYEHFAQTLAMGTLEAEPLAMVVSAWEDEQQDRLRPEPTRQYGIHFDSKLTIPPREDT